MTEHLWARESRGGRVGYSCFSAWRAAPTRPSAATCADRLPYDGLTAALAILFLLATLVVVTSTPASLTPGTGHRMLGAG